MIHYYYVSYFEKWKNILKKTELGRITYFRT